MSYGKRSVVQTYRALDDAYCGAVYDHFHPCPVLVGLLPVVFKFCYDIVLSVAKCKTVCFVCCGESSSGVGKPVEIFIYLGSELQSGEYTVSVVQRSYEVAAIVFNTVFVYVVGACITPSSVLVEKAGAIDCRVIVFIRKTDPVVSSVANFRSSYNTD